MDATTILQAVQTGLSGVLLLVLSKLWKSYEIQNERMYQLLLDAEAERRVLAHEMGYDTKRLQDMATKVKKSIADKHQQNAKE